MTVNILKTGRYETRYDGREMCLWYDSTGLFKSNGKELLSWSTAVWMSKGKYFTDGVNAEIVSQGRG